MEQHEGQTTETTSGQNLSNDSVNTVEKQVPQSVVNRIVGETKKEAYEQGIKVGQASTHLPLVTTNHNADTVPSSFSTGEI